MTAPKPDLYEHRTDCGGGTCTNVGGQCDACADEDRTDLQTCPQHGDTLGHAEDQPGYEPPRWDEPSKCDGNCDWHEHLVCTELGCNYEVTA